MKKLLCVALSLTLLLGSVVSVSGAEADYITPEYPIVVVRGMDFDGLYLDYGTETQSDCLGTFTAEGLIRSIATGAVGMLKGGGLDALAKGILDYVKTIMGTMACDGNGESVYNVSTRIYTGSLADYPDFAEEIKGGGTNEVGIASAAADRYGAEYVYYVNYDWRLHPCDNADVIATVIEAAKADHNTDKVNLICCSMGGAVADAYIYEYGYKSLNKCCFLSSTFCGAYVATDLLQGKVEITSEGLYNFLTTSMGESFWLNAAYKLGIFKLAEKILVGFVSAEQTYVYDNFLRDTFATMPGLWAIVQPEEFEACIDYMFPTDEMKADYAGLIAKAQQLNVIMEGMDDLLVEMGQNGVDVIVTGSYGMALAPVYESSCLQGDANIETELMLGRAVTSNHGHSFDDSYIPANPDKLSADRCVDLSGVLFPESTWVFKNAPHVGCSYGTEMGEFLFWAIEYEGQPTVTSNPKYPQFILSGSDEHIEPLV